MTFYFEKMDKKTKQMAMKVIVHVTVDQDLDVIKFDVDLGSLPNVYLNGYEYVATFEAIDFDNNKTFYTDSNGLEMQKRILNYREYYDFSEWVDPNFPDHNQNISGNYYPIGSAMSMKEVSGERQFTVNNDKSTGGSSVKQGRVEFMQMRRTPCDDNKGVSEHLNETDAFGNGLRMPSSYFVQLHSLKDKASQQRLI